LLQLRLPQELAAELLENRAGGKSDFDEDRTV